MGFAADGDWPGDGRRGVGPEVRSPEAIFPAILSEGRTRGNFRKQGPTRLMRMLYLRTRHPVANKSTGG